MRVTVIPIVIGVHGTILMGLENMIIQNTALLRSDRILRRVLET